MSDEHRLKRRELLAPAAAGAAFMIVPRHVLGGPAYVAPSDKVTLAHIGCGTEGTRELVTGLIQNDQIQIVAVCDPVKDGANYLDWSKNGIRDTIRRVLGDSGFNEGVPGIRAGRDQFQEIVQRYYARNRGLENYRVASYADFRELLDKEKDIDGVKIMTPDHLHAPISLAAMRKGKGVMVHKPLSNRMSEAKLILETARKTRVATHFLAWGQSNGSERIVDRIKEGVIGPLRELHNWTNRPVWPQYDEIPTDRPPVPDGFDWQLWLGPERDRPYHPSYTHMLFRSWYDFGGGCIADVGIYSLWPVFVAMDVGVPLSARAWSSHACRLVDQVANPIVNDYSFPTASTIQFHYSARGDWPALDVYWYDGGTQPRIPELESDPAPVGPEGMLFVGDQGKILTGGVGGPRLITAKGSEPLFPETARPPAGQGGGGGAPAPTSYARGEALWVQAMKGGDPSPGSFSNAGPISETVCLTAVALRAGKVRSGTRSYPAPLKLLYDSAAMSVTNVPEANRYMTREYRTGWEL